ncbi:YbjQ family protein [Rhizobium leguminosarum]|uniref:YbjQ family protein n=1 Tax=Rhizobium leguminosarum TaxID=384 RepID=UPI0009B88895|nr:YbjQ family protein [Rhizobium leguminosarum]
MQTCKECGQEKPNNEVQLGICDKCFNYGAQSHGSQSLSHRGQTQTSDVILTTSIDVPNRQVERVISIIASEAALGMNIFRDIANSFRDFAGGRANSSQKSLREARLACLDGLKREAEAVGADAVIAVDLDYNELSTSGGGGGILFVAASGTAVKLTPL